MTYAFLAVWLITAITLIYEDYRLEAARLRIELYPVVRGQVLKCDKETIVTVNKRSKQETSRYQIECVYQYNWQGTNHYGEEIRPRMKPFTDEAEANDLYAQLPPDRIVKVYVNPANPAEAYLTPGRPAFSWRYTVGAICFGFVLPMAIAYYAYQWEVFSNIAEDLQFITRF